MSKVTSFKTHDPFVVLDHLEGALPAHCSSLILCSLLYYKTCSDTYQKNGFEQTVINMIFVHMFCIVVQMIIRYYKRKEAMIVIQDDEQKRKKRDESENDKDSQSTEALNLQTVDEEQADQLEKILTENKFFKKLRFLKVFYTLGKSFRNDVKEKLRNIKNTMHTNLFQNDKQKIEVSTLHFFGMSLSSVLSTCVYLYFIMDLLVKMFFREHPLLELYGIDRSGDEEKGEETRVRMLLSLMDPPRPPVPSIYILSDFPQQEIIGSAKNCCKQRQDATYYYTNSTGQEINCKDEPEQEFVKCQFQNAAYFMREEAAIFNILIFDFVSQILAILFVCMAQMVIDIGKDSMTDRMNELRYQMKILLVIFNTTISNCITTTYIEQKEHFVNTNITNFTNNIDKTLLVLFFIFLGYAIQLKYRKGHVQTVNQVMKRAIGKLLAAAMIGLQMTKIVLFFFGNLFYIAQFQYEAVPPECILAYMLMKYQFLLCIFFIVDVIDLHNMGKLEAKMIDLLKQESERDYQMDLIYKSFRVRPAEQEKINEAHSEMQKKKRTEEYNLYNNQEESQLVAEIFGTEVENLYSLFFYNVIISDVRIDENETTFNDIAARVLNFNKKQEVQRVHDREDEYGNKDKPQLLLFAEGTSNNDPQVKAVFDKNPFAECIWLELDQRIAYQRVRLYLEHMAEKERLYLENKSQNGKKEVSETPPTVEIQIKGEVVKRKASTVLGVISKIRQIYINRDGEKLEMILNITDGNPMSFKEAQKNQDEEVKVKHFETEDREIDPVTLDITKWVKYEHQEDKQLKEVMKKDQMLIRLIQMKQHFKVFMGCQFQNYSKLVMREEEIKEDDTNTSMIIFKSFKSEKVDKDGKKEKKKKFELYDTDIRQALMTQARKVRAKVEIKYQVDEDVKDSELKDYYDDVRKKAELFGVKEIDINDHLREKFEAFNSKYTDFDGFETPIHLDPKLRKMTGEQLKQFLQKFKITQEQQEEIRNKAKDDDEKDLKDFFKFLEFENGSLLIKRKEIEFYFENLRQQKEKLLKEEDEQDHESNKKKLDDYMRKFQGAKNYFMNKRLQEKIAEYVTQMQSQIKQRQAMRRIEKSVEQLLEYLRAEEMEGFMILQYCQWIDSDVQQLRREPGLFDDTDMFNLFPMILSSQCFQRLYQLKNRTEEERKNLTITEVYDAILQIDFQNEFSMKNGPQDLLESKLNKVLEEAREVIVQIQADTEEQLKDKADKTAIHCERFQELLYEKDWFTAVNGEDGKPPKISRDAKCQDCFKTIDVAYGDFDDIQQARVNKQECNDDDLIPYQFIFYNEHLLSVGKFCCADCGVERRAEVQKQRHLQLEESTYCFSFISMMIDKKSNVTTIQGLYFKAQTVFFIQLMICIFLIYKNIFSGSERQDFIEADPFTLLMRLLTAYLFHIQTLEDAQSAYRRILFLTRYPDRFEPKMRFPALLLCCQQFLINLIAETMNLMILCQLPDFNELVMNYVTFAEILNLDNLYISTQLKYNQDLKKVIDDPSQYPWLQLFKRTKFHKNNQATKTTRICEYLNRIVYKLFYFYLMPLLVIPAGLVGYTYDLRRQKAEDGIENYNWELFLRQKSKYPIQDNVSGSYIRDLNFNFIANENMQLYMFTVLTITYLGGRIGYLYMFKDMKWNKIKLTFPFYDRYIDLYIFQVHQLVLYVFCTPFITMAAFKILLNIQIHLMPKLQLIGLYFKFLPDNHLDSGKDYHQCTAPYWTEQNDTWEYTENCKYLPWANIYFYAFLIFNSIDTDFYKAELVDYFHFTFKTLAQPVICYKIFNQLCLAYTFEPWLDPEGEGASKIRLKQIVFLIFFITLKSRFLKSEREIYNNPDKKPQAKQNICYAIFLAEFFISFIAGNVCGDSIFVIKDWYSTGEESQATKKTKKILIGGWTQLDSWSNVLQFNKAGAYIELYTLIFLMIYVYQFATVWYTKFKSERQKQDDNPIAQKVRQLKMDKKLNLSKDSKNHKQIIDKKNQKIRNLMRIWFFLIPFQAYYMINFGSSLTYKSYLSKLIMHTQENNKELVQNLNPLVFFMSAFSAPYFLMSYILSRILSVLKWLVDTFVIPPWEDYTLKAQNSEFKWYKFFIYYQIYLFLLLVYLAFVQWNIYQLRQIRYKCSRLKWPNEKNQPGEEKEMFPAGKRPNGHLLVKKQKNPYTEIDLNPMNVQPGKTPERDASQRNDQGQDLLTWDKKTEQLIKSEELANRLVYVQCSNKKCKRIIPDGEVFKHCKLCSEDYCYKCWIVPPLEVEDYLASSNASRSGIGVSFRRLSFHAQKRINKAKRMNKIQDWFTGNIQFENSAHNRYAKYLPLLIILGTPALLYFIINICIYYLSYLFIQGTICILSLGWNKGVSQILLGVVFLILSFTILSKMPEDEDTELNKSDDASNGGSKKQEDSIKQPILSGSEQASNTAINQSGDSGFEPGEDGRGFQEQDENRLGVPRDPQIHDDDEPQLTFWQTFTQAVVALKPVNPWVFGILFSITFAISCSFFLIFFNPKNVADKNFKLGFYTYMVIGVVAAFVWEHSIPERFDQKVAIVISILGLILIGQHILAEVVIYYTWHVLADQEQEEYNDYCCWMREDTSICGTQCQ